jgi:hypothetical protein
LREVALLTPQIVVEVAFELANFVHCG